MQETCQRRILSHILKDNQQDSRTGLGAGAAPPEAKRMIFTQTVKNYDGGTKIELI